MLSAIICTVLIYFAAKVFRITAHALAYLMLTAIILAVLSIIIYVIVAVVGLLLDGIAFGVSMISDRVPLRPQTRPSGILRSRFRDHWAYARNLRGAAESYFQTPHDWDR